MSYISCLLILFTYIQGLLLCTGEIVPKPTQVFSMSPGGKQGGALSLHGCHDQVILQYRKPDRGPQWVMCLESATLPACLRPLLQISKKSKHTPFPNLQFSSGSQNLLPHPSVISMYQVVLIYCVELVFILNIHILQLKYCSLDVKQ